MEVNAKEEMRIVVPFSTSESAVIRAYEEMRRRMATIVSKERANEVGRLNQPTSEKITLPMIMPRSRGSSCLVSPMVFTSCDQYAKRKSKAVE